MWSLTIKHLKKPLSLISGGCLLLNRSPKLVFIFTSVTCFCITLGFAVSKRNDVVKLMHSLFRRMNWTKNVPRIVNNEAECHAAVLELRRKCENTRVIGLDCEWVAFGKSVNKVALLQLASVDGHSSLFRLCKIGHVPRPLLELLADSSVLKAGVAVCNDANRLLKDYGVSCNGCIDLRNMAKDIGLEPVGLGKLSKKYLGKTLDKDWRIACSNWEAAKLNQKQIRYASDDAIVSVTLFQYLNNRKMADKFPWWKRCLWTEKQRWNQTQKYWSRYIGIGYTGKGGSGLALDSKKNGTSNVTVTTTRQYYNKPSLNTARKTPLYHNIYLEAPDGEVLTTMDDKKATWYLSKELAKIVQEDPLTLRLNFEPSGRGGAGDGYYALAKDNICAVCGSTHLLRRKNIVPHEYRRFFPLEMKDHSSHDVLLLCEMCHCLSSYQDSQLRSILATECSAPYENKVGDLPDMKVVRSAARALLRSTDFIPEDRKQELKAKLIRHLEMKNQSTELNEDVLKRLSEAATVVVNGEYQSHGERVVEYYKTKSGDAIEGLHMLEQLWRTHFIERMKPKHLPKLWSVSYVHTQHRT